MVNVQKKGTFFINAWNRSFLEDQLGTRDRLQFDPAMGCCVSKAQEASLPVKTGLTEAVASQSKASTATWSETVCEGVRSVGYKTYVLYINRTLSWIIQIHPLIGHQRAAKLLFRSFPCGIPCLAIRFLKQTFCNSPGQGWTEFCNLYSWQWFHRSPNSLYYESWVVPAGVASALADILGAEFRPIIDFVKERGGGCNVIKSIFFLGGV